MEGKKINREHNKCYFCLKVSYLQNTSIKARVNESGFVQCAVLTCVREHVTHIVARLSNLKPGLRAHLSLVVDR